MRNNLLLPIKLAFGELKNGWKHFRVFLACLILGVALMASVNIFSAVVEDSMNEKAQSILGGDFEIKLRGQQANPTHIKFFEDNYGKVSAVSTFRSMLYNKDEGLLVEVKAVDNNYPLIGDLLLNQNISKQDALKNDGVIIDSILLDQLDLKIGDQVNIAGFDFTVRATLKKEPDRVLQFFGFGPRVMMSQESLFKTGLMETLSLSEQRYRIKAKKPIIADDEFVKKVKQDLLEEFPDYGWGAGLSENRSRGVNRFLSQFMTFLNLAGLSTFIIAGIGIAGSIRFYMERKYNSIAVMKILGATRKMIFRKFSLLILALSLIGGVIGVVIAGIITWFAIPIIAELLPSLQGRDSFDIPAALLAIFYGILISFIFSIPTLLSTLEIKASTLFRSKISSLDIINNTRSTVVIFALSMILLLTLIITSRDPKFIAVALSILLLAFGFFAVLTSYVKKLSSKIKTNKTWLKLALRNINRKGSTSGTVIFAIGISMTIFITLNLTERNLQDNLSKIINERAPSLFMIDIQSAQEADFKNLLSKYADEEHYTILPMLRGRVAKINNISISEIDVPEDIKWMTKSDRGISYAAKAPKNADIITGKWWDENYTGKPKISIDERMLDGLALEIGDTITLNILGQEIQAEIASARRIDYATMQINFSMMLSPNVVEKFPSSQIATIYIQEQEEETKLAREISKQFPGVTLIRTKETLEILREVIKSILTALNVTVFITLLAGILVLASALNATIRQRVYDIAMLKVLGANKTDILKICISEWAFLAIATSFIAISLGTFSSYLIIKKFRTTEFDTMPFVSLLTTLACIFIVCLIGYLVNKKLFSIRPANLLRND